MPHKKISRNDPCPCGSGKTFKHSCIGKDIAWQTTATERGHIGNLALLGHLGRKSIIARSDTV